MPRRQNDRYMHALKVVNLITILAFFIIPLFTVDILLTGRVDKVILSVEKVYERGVLRDIPIEAYVALMDNPIEVIVRLLIFFSALYAAAKISEEIALDPLHKSYSYFLGILIAVQLIVWLPAWLFSARLAPFAGSKYEFILRLVNLVSACHIYYWTAIYRYITTPEYMVLSIPLILIPWAAGKAGASIVKMVKWATVKAAERRAGRRILESKDPVMDFTREFMSLLGEAETYKGHLSSDENIVNLSWSIRVKALESALEKMPRNSAIKIYREIQNVQVSNERLRQLKEKVRSKAEEEFREAVRVHAPQPSSVKPTRPPTPPVIQRKPAEPPVQPTVQRRPVEHHQTKPVFPREVEERLIDASEERRRLQEKMALYESIASLKIFDRVVGLREVKEEIAWRFLIPVLFPEKAPEGVEPKLGILLYGPPGIGKTEIMRLLKEVCERVGIRVFEIKPTDVNRMWVGEGEKIVHSILSEAKKAPSIVFIDEAEVAMGKPMLDESHTKRGPVAQLLQDLDGVRSSSEKMLLIAATNKPWNIDEAFLRPGRIDRMFFVKPPSREERIELFKRGVMRLNIDGQIDFERLANLTEPSRAGYYSGADIAEICKRASVKAARAGRKVTMADLEEAVKEAKPSIPSYLIAEYERFAGIRGGAEEQKGGGQPFYTA